MSDGLRYENSGVNYDSLDAFKRFCQQAAATTREALAGSGYGEPRDVRGESAFLLEGMDHYLAHVEEGLGTKNLVADAMLALTGKSYYASIGIDTVATIVNDLITCGALPLSVAMHAAVGDGKWFDQPGRARELAEGFAEGCRQAQAIWGGGETPALKGIVSPDSIVLAGSAMGKIFPKSRRVLGNIAEGDAIVLLASSGVQTNGLSLCRLLAERLQDGYQTPMKDGRAYGQALLDPSAIYVKFVSACQHAGLQPHYLAHLTGHGWRKLMRPSQRFVYQMDNLGNVPEIFRFIMENGPVEVREAYATFNMGAGFAAYVDPADATQAVEIAQAQGYHAWIGGRVVQQDQRKAVELLPLGIIFDEQSLQVR